jgi:hypothetical protein
VVERGVGDNRPALCLLRESPKLLKISGRHFRLVLVRLTQHVAPAPYRFNVVLAIRRGGELLAQLANKDVDDLDHRLVHATVELDEEHFLGQRRALAQREELEDLVLLADEMHTRAIDLDRLGVEVDDEIAGLDDGLGVALGAAHDGVDARDQFVLVEWLGHVVIGAEAETFDLVLDAGKAEEDQDRRHHFGDAEGAQNLKARYVGQVQVQQDDVVVVEFAEVDALFANVRRVDVKTLEIEHQLNRLGSCSVILNQQYAHASPLSRRSGGP